MSAITFDDSMTGKAVPSVTWQVFDGSKFNGLSSDSIFKGKRVAVFSLPGAFTPTCSSTHLPRYNELADTLKSNGIDSIYCISVNDTFVMSAWKKDQEAANIGVIPDGNGDFTEGMGMLLKKAELGFGVRSWRYSMVVNNGIVEKMFVEPMKAGDPFEVSDADTMLNYINPGAKTVEKASIFTRAGCPHCARAKSLLKANNIPFEEIVLEGRTLTTRSLMNITGKSSVPQVYIAGKLIGGADELETYFSTIQSE